MKSKKEIFDKMNFISFYVACFCCACFYTLLTPFVSNVWFDSSYKISVAVVAVLTVNFYIAVMVLPVESFRTANGLFVQGWFRPIIMAIMNIILDFFMGKQWGIIGIFLATTISRILTQVWYDSYLIYKMVFQKKPWRYYADYVIKAIVTLVICVVTGTLAGLVSVNSVYLDFMVKMVMAVLIPNIALIIIYHKNENLKYMFSIAVMKLSRKR